MERLQKLEEKIKEGGMLTSEEALWLLEEAPFEELCEVAHRITVAYASRKFDMCSIINAKSGRCPENCKWCAQSVHHHTGVEEYGLVSEEECLRQAKMNENQGVARFSLVTSGRRPSAGSWTGWTTRISMNKAALSRRSYGSRMASSSDLISGWITYSITRRRPTRISTCASMPGISRKFSGTPRSLTLSSMSMRAR